MSVTSGEENDSSAKQKTQKTYRKWKTSTCQKKLILSDASRNVLFKRCHSLRGFYLIVKTSKNFNKGFLRVIMNKQDTVEL